MYVHFFNSPSSVADKYPTTHPSNIFSAYTINCAIFLLYPLAKYLPDMHTDRVGVGHIIHIRMCMLHSTLLLYLLVRLYMRLVTRLCRMQGATYIL